MSGLVPAWWQNSARAPVNVNVDEDVAIDITEWSLGKDNEGGIMREESQSIAIPAASCNRYPT